VPSSILGRLTALDSVVRVLLRVMPPVDRFLLTVTRGRFGSAPGHTLLLVTTGARSGLRRETPLFFVRDGQRLVLVPQLTPDRLPEPDPQLLPIPPDDQLAVARRAA